jgi:hypothetical protein
MLGCFGENDNMVSLTDDDIRPYLPDVMKLRATPAMIRVGVDDADVQQEAAIAAMRAIAWYRDKHKPAGPRQSYRRGCGPTHTTDELRFVRASIRNAVIQRVRAARAGNRRFDPLDRDKIQANLYGTSLSGAFGHAAEVTPTPAETFEQQARAEAIDRAARRIRDLVGDRTYGCLIERARDVSWDEIRTDTQDPNAHVHTSVAVKKLRCELAAVTMEEMMAQAPAPEETPVDALTDDELARVALVHELPVKEFKRPSLLKIVNDLNYNKTAKVVDNFPVCFRDAKQYDPNHSACNPDGGECDFKTECRVNIAAFADPEIEKKLAALKEAIQKAPPPPKPEKPKAVKPEPVKDEASAVVEAAEPKEDKMESAAGKKSAPTSEAATSTTRSAPKAEPVKVGNVYADHDPRAAASKAAYKRGELRRVVVVEVTKKHAVVVNAENVSKAGLVIGRKTKIAIGKLGVWSERKGYEHVGVRAVRLDEPKKDEPKKEAPPKASAPAKAAKAKPEKAKAKKGKKADDVAPTKAVEGIYFSKRKGVLPAGKRGYSTDPDTGKRWFRLPQGSAGYMRTLPVGSVVERAYNGHTYKAKKVSAEGNAGGTWQLTHHDGKPYGKPFEGSLGQVTFHVTGNNAWSAAKFWNLLPPELDAKSPKFNPEAFDPDKYFVYGAGGKEADA